MENSERDAAGIAVDQWAWNGNVMPSKTNDGVPLDLANILRYADAYDTLFETIERVKGSPMNETRSDGHPVGGLLDTAEKIVTAFKAGNVGEFEKQGRMMYSMTGRAVYEKGWAARWTIKNLADGIIMAEARKGAGNSGTH